MNFLSRLLRDVKGVGCKIEKDWKRGGYGWRLIVDGKSTDEMLPDGSSPFDDWFDVRGTIGLHKVVAARAYWTEAEEGDHDANEIVAPDVAFDEETMYLFPTWDLVRHTDDY